MKIKNFITLFVLLLSLSTYAQSPTNQWLFVLTSPTQLPIKEKILYINTREQLIKLTIKDLVTVIDLNTQPYVATGWYRVVVTVPDDYGALMVQEISGGGGRVQMIYEKDLQPK
jgi:hypothetical protein